MKRRITFPRRACGTSPRRDLTFGCSPALSPWNSHAASIHVYAILVRTPTLTNARRCGTSRLNEFGRARGMLSYISLIPRLRALMSNCTYATHLQYHADEHAETRRPGTITDIFDGHRYRSLLGDRTYTSRIIVISHSASPPTASLLLKSGSIPRGSSFSTTISL